jgi:hypothetical protein
MLRILVKILLRQANAQSPEDPAGWLTALQLAKWNAVNAQNGQITGTMVNGKSVTLSVSGAFSLADILNASEIALQCVEQGLSSLPSRTQAVLN